jgi:hypothetical protein
MSRCGILTSQDTSTCNRQVKGEEQLQVSNQVRFIIGTEVLPFAFTNPSSFRGPAWKFPQSFRDLIACLELQPHGDPRRNV